MCSDRIYPASAIVLWFFPLGMLLVILAKSDQTWNDPWESNPACRMTLSESTGQLQLVANAFVTMAW